MNPLRIAQYSLTGCEGCAFALLCTILEDPLLSSAVEITASRALGHGELKEADIAFVDGCIMTSNDLELVKTIRGKSRTLVALGACAHMIGIPALRIGIDLPKAIKKVYGQGSRAVTVREFLPLYLAVKVDYVIPGCPPPREEVKRLLSDMLLGKEFRLSDKPVCFECRTLGIRCLLEEGRACLGPITRAGCNAICPQFSMPCWGCRGPADELRLEQFLEAIKEHHISLTEVNEKVRIFLTRTRVPSLLKLEGKRDV